MTASGVGSVAATAAVLNAPIGVFVDTTGCVFVTEFNSHLVRKIVDNTASVCAGWSTVLIVCFLFD